MNLRALYLVVPGIAALVAGVALVVLLIVKVLWAWTVPDLFPGAVSQGLVASDISWYTALKLAIFVAFLAGVAGLRRGSPVGRGDE